MENRFNKRKGCTCYIATSWQGLSTWNSCQGNRLLPAPHRLCSPSRPPFSGFLHNSTISSFPTMRDYNVVMLCEAKNPSIRGIIKAANCQESKSFNSLVLPNLKYKQTCFIGLECFQHDPISVCVYSSKLEKIAWLQSAKMSAAPISLGWHCQLGLAASKLSNDSCGCCGCSYHS